jgi:acyl-CoA thioesterase-1
MIYAPQVKSVTLDLFALTLATLLGALLLVTPFTSNATEVKRPKAVVVSIIGDSLSAGFGVDKAYAYPNLLQQSFDASKDAVKIINAGVSGNTTAGGLRRLAWIMRGKPDVLLIALGGNDGLRGIDPKSSKANLTAMIDTAREKNPSVKILLAGMKSPPNMGKTYTSAFEAIYDEIAKEKKVALIPFLLEGVAGHADMNLPDGIHPNPAGHQKIRDVVLPHLQNLLK